MKRRLLALAAVLALLCTLALPAGAVTPTIPAGSGTAADPYRIGTAEELYWFAQQVNGGASAICAKLTDDIAVNKNVLKEDGALADDTSGFTPWTPIGSGGAPYTGSFDGQSHTISGLYLKAEASQYNLGFFGSVDGGGAVKNLTIAGSYFYGGDRVGTVVGYLANGTVESCHNVGSTVYIVGDSGGGIVGYASGDTAVICRCSNSGLLRVANSDVGLYRVGGIVGQVANGAVTYCVSTGAFKCAASGEYVGGIAGDVGGRATVSHCANTGDVRGYNFVGGLCGNVASGAELSACWSTGGGSTTGGYDEGAVVGSAAGTVSVDCYYLTGLGNRSGHGTAATQTQFDNGTICTATGVHNARNGACAFCGAKDSAQIAGTPDSWTITANMVSLGRPLVLIGAAFADGNAMSALEAQAITLTAAQPTASGSFSFASGKLFLLDSVTLAPLCAALK